uniref:B box-type domain-containing protein n=1 Tax=Aegilops tauschii TaxID=37682 RepID=N1QWU0_AEGTA
MEPDKSTGASRPRCALCGAGADVHCYADAAFSCAMCHAQAHCTSSLASHHRLTRVQPEPNHVRAKVSARAMDLDPWVARLRVPPPNDVRTEVTARAMGLDPWAVRLRAAAAGSTRVPLPNNVRTEVTTRAMELEPRVARLGAAEAGSTRVPPPNNVRTEVTASAMGLDPCAARLRAGGTTCGPPPTDVCRSCEATFLLLARRVGLDVGAAHLRAAAASRRLRFEFADAPPMPLRVAMAVALWREVADHGVVHQPGRGLQLLAAWAHMPTSYLVAVATAIEGVRQVRTTAVDVEEDSVDSAIGGACEVRTVALDVEEDSVDCAIGGAREVRMVALDVEED